MGKHRSDEFSFKNNKEFVLSMNKCIDYLNWTTASDQRIPRDIIVAMAIVASLFFLLLDQVLKFFLEIILKVSF